MAPFLPLFLLFLLTSTTSKPSSSSSSSSPSASPSLISLMSTNHCKLFSSLLSSSSSDALSTFQSNIPSGLTVFCPSDSSLSPFLPTFKNLSSDSQLSLLLFHAIPIYTSLQSLRSSNGVVNTLATDGTNNNFNFTVQNNGASVTLKTPLTTALILTTIFDKDPLSVFKIDNVLKPRELFKPVEAPAPAPAPAAEPPTAVKKKNKKHKHNSPPAPPESSPEPSSENDKAADVNVGFRCALLAWRELVLSLVVVVVISS